MAKTKILVISRDSVLVGLLKKRHFENSYQFICVQDTGDELRAVVYQESPDFAIVDIMMPRLDGIEISLRIRQWSQIPILMLSTWEAGPNSVRRFDLSTENYLSEPLGIYEIIILIEGALRNKGIVPAINRSNDMHPVPPEYSYVGIGTKLKIECAWCGRYMGERDGYGVEGVSHSICERCSAKLEGTRKVGAAATKSSLSGEHHLS